MVLIRGDPMASFAVLGTCENKSDMCCTFLLNLKYLVDSAFTKHKASVDRTKFHVVYNSSFYEYLDQQTTSLISKHSLT